jgi:hypothetical protein
MYREKKRQGTPIKYHSINIVEFKNKESISNELPFYQ